MADLTIKTAFKYPFNRAKGMLNIFLIFLPIVGWFALGGYGIRIIQEFSKGKFKKLPTLSFGSDFTLGFFMFIKAIPFVISYIAVTLILERVDPRIAGVTNLLIGLFIVPVLNINFMNKQTVESFFEFKILKAVLNNLGEYIIIMLKSLVLQLIFGIMSIILIGIPAGVFTKSIFLADFYRRRVKGKR